MIGGRDQMKSIIRSFYQGMAADPLRTDRVFPRIGVIGVVLGPQPIELMLDGSFLLIVGRRLLFPQRDHQVCNLVAKRNAHRDL